MMSRLVVVVVFPSHASRFCSHTYNETSKLNWIFLDDFVCCQDMYTRLPLAQSGTDAPMTTPDPMSCSLYLHCFQPVSAASPRSPATIRCLLILSALRPLVLQVLALAKATNCVYFLRQPSLSLSNQIAYDDLKISSRFAQFHQLSAYALHVFLPNGKFCRTVGYIPVEPPKIAGSSFQKR